MQSLFYNRYIIQAVITHSQAIELRFSFDSPSKPDDMIRAAKRRRSNVLGVMDHKTIKGGIKARRINHDRDFLVIVGSEIATEVGKTIRLFLNEEIESRVSVEIAEEIHRHRGIAVPGHPFRGSRLNDEIIKQVDVIALIPEAVKKIIEKQ